MFRLARLSGGLFRNYARPNGGATNLPSPRWRTTEAAVLRCPPEPAGDFFGHPERFHEKAQPCFVADRFSRGRAIVVEGHAMSERRSYHGVVAIDPRGRRGSRIWSFGRTPQTHPRCYQNSQACRRGLPTC
jgi:hypothetical protein